MHEHFVDLGRYVPGLACEIRYATDHNLTGHPLSGYTVPKALGTVEMGNALRLAMLEAKSKGYGLLVYDAYRPQKAVNDFILWSAMPEDYLTKDEFYPEFPRDRLFSLGFLARRSGHSRGSTIDLTLTENGEPLDMGTGFDFMGIESHVVWDGILPEHLHRRRILYDIMKTAGFRSYQNEWWHFTLENEPFPDTYFDFDIE